MAPWQGRHLGGCELGCRPRGSRCQARSLPLALGGDHGQGLSQRGLAGQEAGEGGLDPDLARCWQRWPPLGMVRWL